MSKIAEYLTEDQKRRLAECKKALIGGKISEWFKTPQQQPQADASDGADDNSVIVKIGEHEHTVDKEVADLLINRGQKQASQNIVKKAIKIIPEEMGVTEKTNPTKIIEQLSSIIHAQVGQIADFDSKAKEQQDQEPEELKKAKADLAAKANDLSTREAELYKNFAREKAIAGVLSSAKRDFNLTEESEGLYAGMIVNVFDSETDTDGNGGFVVSFSKKGEGFPFMPDSKPPTSKQLAELIAKQYPGNHGNGVQPGLGSRRTAQPGIGTVKPLNEQPLRQVEDRAWA